MMTYKRASETVQDKALRLIDEGRVVDHGRPIKVYTVFGDSGTYDVKMCVSPWRKIIYEVECPCRSHVVCSHMLAGMILAERDGYRMAS